MIYIRRRFGLAKQPYRIDLDQLGELAGWCLTAGKDGLLLRSEGGRFRHVSRVLAGIARGVDEIIVDRINRDHRDLRSLNLRVEPRASDSRNRGKAPECSSRYKHVSCYGQMRKWVATIQLRDSTHAYLGTFDAEGDAALVANFFALIVAPEASCYNDPTSKRGGLTFAEFDALRRDGVCVLPVRGTALHRAAERRLEHITAKYGVPAVLGVDSPALQAVRR